MSVNIFPLVVFDFGASRISILAIHPAFIIDGNGVSVKHLLIANIYFDNDEPNFSSSLKGVKNQALKLKAT